MFEALSHHRDPIEAKLQSKPSPGLRPPSPAGRWCRAAADEGGQRLGQYHPSPGLRIGRCEVGPDSPIGRQPFISLFFLLPPRRVTGGRTTSTIRISPFLPQSRPNACPQRNETGSPETTSKTLSIATSHQPSPAPRSWPNRSWRLLSACSRPRGRRARSSELGHARVRHRSGHAFQREPFRRRPFPAGPLLAPRLPRLRPSAKGPVAWRATRPP